MTAGSAVSELDTAAGTVVTEYRGPSFLRSISERLEIKTFDRVTQLRIGAVDLEKFDSSVLPKLELIKGNWAWPLKGTDKLKWEALDVYPLTKKIKESYSPCQLTIESGPAIKIDMNASCSMRPAD